MGEMELTLGIVKPHAYEHRYHIRYMITANNMGILTSRNYKFDDRAAKKHYAEHEGKPFFKDVVDMITEGDAYILLVYGEGSIKKLRDLAGPTDPREAKELIRATRADNIRGAYGIDRCRNAFHCSDSRESALREIDMYFKPKDMPEEFITVKTNMKRN